MIELYGNKIWNSNTPNKYKKVIIASEDSLDNICQELENSGLNYCAYIFNGEAHIAIGRATANNIDKLDIDYQTVIECNSKVYKTNNIIGTTTYDSIEDKLYRKYNTDFAYKIGQRLTEQGILFSGRIYGKTTTITVDKQYADTLNKISAELKEQRASFMSKSEVVQNESPEESKSVNEKISELHFNESQLSALAPSVKFIQTRNDDNLTDNFVSLFSDCTDFYESQLSALAEIYVDTYRSFSDKSLIFADTSRFNDLKQRFVNDNITAKLTENRGYSTTQFEIIREMVTYGMSESVINLLDYTFSIDEMQNFFTAYKNGSYEDLINLIADIKGTTRTDIEGQIEGGTYTPALPDFNTLEKTLYFQESEVESITYMYYNPDAYSGGQFVITEVSYKQIAEANKEYGDDFSGFFDFLDTTGEQRLIDIGSESFRTAVKKFYSGTEFAEGLNADIQHKLVELAVVPEIKLPEVRKIELIKVGDFYEVRGENAKTVADILDLVSTTRNINGSSVDTVGFPDFKLNDNTELLKTQGFTVNIKYEELAPFYEEHDELDDIDPAVIRQQLEDAGIVNGELVDEDKLNSDPFIQQVMAVAESDAGALNVSSEEIVNQFNSENEIVPINEPERTESVQEIIRPTITCDWSESPVFENGKTYSVSEFDTLMKNADDEWVEQRQLEIEEYGSENAVAEAYRNGELDNIHLGYEKTKFIVNMPNGTTHTFRQDIGDGDGGVIDFLKQYPQYSGVVKILEADIKLDKGENEKAADLPITESKEREVRSDEKLQSVDELAVEVENAAPSRAEKAEVTVVNKAEPPTLFDMVESSEQTETSVNDEKAKNYVIEDREAVTGAKTKFQNNIAAIKILKQTEAENRAATPEEQGQLFLYSGWGGLANAFESDNDKWKNEYSELKGLLTDEEYTAARSTVLDSFYTDTAIVDSIYEVIRNAGFEDGNIKSDIDNVKSFVDKDGKLICKLTLGSQTFNLKNDEERKNAAKALTTAVAQVRIADNRKKQVSVGNICGFDISVINNGNVYDDIVVTIKGKYSYSAQLGVSAVHNLSKIEGLLYKTESVLDYSQNSLNKLDLDYKTSVALLEKPFEYEAELQEKSARLSELTKILNIELAHQKTESKPKTHYFGKDKILGRNKSSKQIQNKTVMKSEPKRSEPEL